MKRIARPKFTPATDPDRPLIQEELLTQGHGIYAHMVAVILLNVTTGAQARAVIPSVLCAYPDPEAMARADLRRLGPMMRPLGLWRQRAKTLRDMARAFTAWDFADAAALPGIGKYGSDSYRIFFKGERPSGVTDKRLLSYLARTE